MPSLLSGVTYNGRDEPLTLTRPNGVGTTYTYQASRDWLMSLVSAKGSTTLQEPRRHPRCPRPGLDLDQRRGGRELDLRL